MKLLILATLISIPAKAYMCDWPVPEYTIQSSATSGISREQYDAVLDSVESKMKWTMYLKGLSLKIHRSWSDSTVNAQAWVSGKVCNVEMFGGLARFPGISPEGIRHVALHEIGHCIGGYPFYPNTTLSAEGQADYWSTSVGCQKMGVACKDSSLNVAIALARMGGESLPKRPSPTLPAVSRTVYTHPKAQCRLNTFDAGLVKSPRPRCWFYK